MADLAFISCSSIPSGPLEIFLVAGFEKPLGRVQSVELARPRVGHGVHHFLEGRVGCGHPAQRLEVCPGTL